MIQTAAGVNFPDSLPARVLASIDKAMQLALVTAFVATSLFPGKALAAAGSLAFSQQPLQFKVDEELVDSALTGHEDFSKNRTRLSQIPAVLAPVTAGMTVKVMASAYSSTVDQTSGDPFITASGTRVQDGTLAANFLPFGATVRIAGKIYTVEDRLNARYNGKYIIDVWFPTREDALAFGVRAVDLEVVSLP